MTKLHLLVLEYLFLSEKLLRHLVLSDIFHFAKPWLFLKQIFIFMLGSDMEIFTKFLHLGHVSI